jgi:hypothetical protein
MFTWRTVKLMLGRIKIMKMKKALFLLTLFNISVFSFGQSANALPDSIEIADDFSPLRKEAFHASEIIYRVPKNKKFALVKVNYDGYFEVRNESFSSAFIFYPFVKNGKVIFQASQKSKLSIDKAAEIRKSKQLIDEAAEIRRNDSIADIMNKRSKEESKPYLESLKKEIIKQKAVFVKKYGPINGEKVAKGLIWIGMTEAMLLDSWGQPEDINTTVTKYSTRKQYVYGSGRYVYVENGKVDAWQN